MGKKSSSRLGHKKLEKVFTLMVAAMVSRYTVVVRQMSANRGEEVRFGRFINNQKVSPEGIIGHHWDTSRRDFSGKHLLVVNDTSTLSFDSDRKRDVLGHVGANTTKEGFDIHPSILVDAETCGVYGLGGIAFHKYQPPVTEEEKSAKKERYRALWKTPFEEKERYKWFSSPRQAIDNCKGAASYTLLGDRESDIYDLMSLTLGQGWDFVYRSNYDRPLSTGGKLRGAIDGWAAAHSYSLRLPSTRKRSAHVAELELKFGHVRIKRPVTRRDGRLPPDIPVHAVEVRERASSVVKGEEPVHWILLTSHPVENVGQALRTVKWYCWRWTIEESFRTVKLKGMDIEHSMAKSFHALKNMATLALVAAIQVMQLVKARDGGTGQSIADVFPPEEQKCLNALNTKLEGRTQKQKNPHPAPSLAFASWVIARLGGWKGYRSERPPGPITMIRGLIRFFQILEGYCLIL